MRPFAEVCLRIGGYHNNDGNIGGEGVNPNFCTQLLGIAPNTQWEKGDPCPSLPSGMELTRRINLWMYSTENRVENDDPYDPLPHINHIIQVFSEKKAQFNQIHSTGNVCISICITWGVQHGSYTLDRQMLETILKMGIDEIRYIFVGIEDEEEDEMATT